MLPQSSIRRDILVPRYYDPRIASVLDELGQSHRLFSLNDLVASGHLEHTHGNYVPKIFYGSGPFPYIRTSDLANYEVIASPKHGLSEDVYLSYALAQDVRADDILFVHEGTYLIGSASIVSPFDGPMLYQHHLAKFRCLSRAEFGPYFLLAALASPVVQAQIRAKQFSADIIDSVVGRLGEVVIPVPTQAIVERTEAEVLSIVTTRASLREQLGQHVRELEPALIAGEIEAIESVLAWEPRKHQYEGQTAFLGDRRSFASYLLRTGNIKQDILVPKYYDPAIDSLRDGFSRSCQIATIGDLADGGVLSIDTGDEIGRMNYGTGPIPFVRTSDFASWELKYNPKQGVSDDVFEAFGAEQDVEPGDILLVRDGTYLVGSSVLVTEHDTPLLYCGGIIKLRSLDRSMLAPGMLFAILNLPFVRRQMRNKQFTRDIIDTLGTRIREVVVPIPKDRRVRQRIARKFECALGERRRLLAGLGKISQDLYPTTGWPIAART